MLENTWLIILGIVLIIFELLFGAISGFDIALIGLSLIIGGTAHYYSSSYQLGIVVSILVMLVYFVYFRKMMRKKLLVSTQKIGIDSLAGKIGVVIDSMNKSKVGKVLVDGEVWRAKSRETLKENQEIMVVKLEGVTLEVTKERLT